MSECAPPFLLHSLQGMHGGVHALWDYLLLGAHKRSGLLQVVDMGAPFLLHNTSRLLWGLLPSSFSRLRHLILLIDSSACSFDQPSQLNTVMAEIGTHSQLESLYIGFMHGFGCSIHGRIRADPEDSVSVCLSDMQHLKSVPLDSFWPALLELPPRASLHATFRSAPGQKHPGLRAGRPADVLDPQLPLRSAHFLPESGLGAEHAITAKELWPLNVKRSLELIRVRAGILHLDLSEFPGLMQAEAVLITASECHLCIPGNQVAFKHLGIKVCKGVRVLFITNIAAFVARVESLTIIFKRLMDSGPLSLPFLSNAMLAAGKKLNTNCRRTLCQPEGKREDWSCGWGNASLGAGSGSTDPGEWAHAPRCCCHACQACLHCNGAAAFPEAIA